MLRRSRISRRRRESFWALIIRRVAIVTMILEGGDDHGAKKVLSATDPDSKKLSALGEDEPNVSQKNTRP